MTLRGMICRLKVEELVVWRRTTGQLSSQVHPMKSDLSEDLPRGFTQLLTEAARSDPQAAATALSAAYQVLRKLAQGRLKGERRNHTLSATDLVHEIIPKLFPALRPPPKLGAIPSTPATADSPVPGFPATTAPPDSASAPDPEAWTDRKHFVATAAMTMRNFLIDYARSRGRQKHAGGRKRMPLETANVAELAARADPDEIMDLDEAFNQLAEKYPDVGKVVSLKFYAGLTNEQVADVLEISPETVKRRWKFARAFLINLLRSDDPGGGNLA